MRWNAVDFSNATLTAKYVVKVGLLGKIQIEKKFKK